MTEFTQLPNIYTYRLKNSAFTLVDFTIPSVNDCSAVSECLMFRGQMK